MIDRLQCTFNDCNEEIREICSYIFKIVLFRNQIETMIRSCLQFLFVSHTCSRISQKKQTIFFFKNLINVLFLHQMLGGSYKWRHTFHRLYKTCHRHRWKVPQKYFQVVSQFKNLVNKKWRHDSITLLIFFNLFNKNVLSSNRIVAI